MEGVYSLQPEQVWGERESQQLQVNTSPSVKLRKFQQRSSWWDVRTELQPLEESWFMNQQSQQNCCKDTNCRNKRWDLFVFYKISSGCWVHRFLSCLHKTHFISLLLIYQNLLWGRNKCIISVTAVCEPSAPVIDRVRLIFSVTILWIMSLWL